MLPNLARGMQCERDYCEHDWLAELAFEPGPRDAKRFSGPGSHHATKSGVSGRPDSRGAS